MFAILWVGVALLLYVAGFGPGLSLRIRHPFRYEVFFDRMYAPLPDPVQSTLYGWWIKVDTDIPVIENARVFRP